MSARRKSTADLDRLTALQQHLIEAKRALESVQRPNIRRSHNTIILRHLLGQAEDIALELIRSEHFSVHGTVLIEDSGRGGQKEST